MCTVTFIPKSLDGFMLTSNRDEAPARRAIQPKIYKVNDVELFFPKDDVAGGTWFGLSSKKTFNLFIEWGFYCTREKRQLSKK